MNPKFFDSDDSSDSDYDPTTPYSKKSKSTSYKTFIPVPGSEISTFRTIMWKHNKSINGCTFQNTWIFAHDRNDLRQTSDPVPNFAVSVYKKLKKIKKKKKQKEYEKAENVRQHHSPNRGLICSDSDLDQFSSKQQISAPGMISLFRFSRPIFTTKNEHQKW